ncbi:MAG: NUDIX hydrolase [Candidatus Nanopelagicales bacterium]
MSASRRPRLIPAKGLEPVKALRNVRETSAGGLVLNLNHPDRPAALIGRYDRKNRLNWSLPKGHIEKGETREQAAKREVLEETGILGEVIAPLGTIRFWFSATDKRIQKTVHHFLLLAETFELNADDPEIDEVAWVPFLDLKNRLRYDDEIKLLTKVPGLLGELW